MTKGIVRPPVRAQIFHPHIEAREGGIDSWAYGYIEAFAEKFRALAERVLPRDHSDVVIHYRDGELRPESFGKWILMFNANVERSAPAAESDAWLLKRLRHGECPRFTVV